MKLNNFAYSYSKPLRNHTLKIMKIIPGNLLKKTWKNHGKIMEFCQPEKVGTLLTVPGRSMILPGTIPETPISHEWGWFQPGRMPTGGFVNSAVKHSCMFM